MRKWRGICGESGCCLEKDHKGVCSFVAIEEHDYEVEAIVAQRRTRKGTEYLVKWLNWPTEDNTWEFEANLAGAGEVLAAWKRSHLKPCVRNAPTATAQSAAAAAVTPAVVTGAPSTDGAAHDADTSVAPPVDPAATPIVSDGDDDAAPPIIVVTPTAAPAPSWSQPPAPQQPPPPCSLPTPRPASVFQPEPVPQPPLASLPAPPRPLPAPPPPPPLLSTSVAKAAGIVRRPQMPPATVTRDVRLEGYKALLVQLKQQQQQQQQAIQREAKRGLASDGR
jgi:hypothetical protein